MLKKERESKVTDKKENQKGFINSILLNKPEEPSPDELTLVVVEKDFKKQYEEKELLETSLLDDIDGDLQVQQNEKIEKVPVEPTVSLPTLASKKLLSSKAANFELSIFKELQGIDFDTEIQDEEEGKIDWNKVSCWHKELK